MNIKINTKRNTTNITYISSAKYNNRHPKSINWQSRLIKKGGTPDKKLIALAELVIYWNKPQKIVDAASGEKRFIHKFLGQAWQTSYSYLSQQLKCSKDTIRRKLVILEKLGYVKRIFETISIRGQEYNNRLFLQVNNSFYKKVTGFNKISYSKDEDFLEPENKPPYPKKKPPLYIDINNIKYRSMKSSSVKDNFKEKESANSDGSTNSNSSNNKINNEANNNSDNNNISSQDKKELEAKTRVRLKPKQLKDFYPLSQEDAITLAAASGRNCKWRGMNELLRDASNKLRDRWFRTKAAFMSYMTKFLKYEMRDMEKINNENFRIKSRQTDQSQEALQERLIEEQEKYLEQIEYSLQVSPEWHLKKKLCAVLERKKAYAVLKSFRFGKIEGSNFKLYLSKYVSLGKRDKEIILDQIKATHEGAESRSRIGELSEVINSLEIMMPSEDSSQSASSVSSTSNASSKVIPAVVPQFVGVWGKIRQLLISHYRNQGEALDRSWFSKLEAEEDQINKKLTLKAPTSFICSYIQQNYQYAIQECCKDENYKQVSICWPGGT